MAWALAYRGSGPCPQVPFGTGGSAAGSGVKLGLISGTPAQAGDTLATLRAGAGSHLSLTGWVRGAVSAKLVTDWGSNWEFPDQEDGEEQAWKMRFPEPPGLGATALVPSSVTESL